MNEQKWKNKIYYSQCWEDPYVLLEGLEINKEDKIISITSGGCNTLTLLLKDPKEIIALDINSAQNYLLELKISAIKHLSYDNLLAFLGIESCDNRINLYSLLKNDLSKDSQEWWDNNTKLIAQGVIHVGKLERYFRVFSRFILPLIHSKKTVQFLFTQKTQEQQYEFYNKKWNTWRWRFLFSIFFSKKLTSNNGRNKQLFKYVSTNNITDHYLIKIKNSICIEPAKNFFLHYMFTGKYDKSNLPLYLRKENVPIIRERINRIQIVSEDIATYIKKNPKKYTKYNLSNIFETLSVEETHVIFKDIIEASGYNARLVYINHLVDRTFYEELNNIIVHDIKNEDLLNKQNMAFFYKKIHIDYIK
ncbi:MAG: BtaA family protein [Candidatus Pacebacteria bacterium]|nr:BtaA family protein [Candidatus Paceibacterota bacterium]MCF7863107.1 BtaA family protein [Candidatus Paceibacterota bacterium]